MWARSVPQYRGASSILLQHHRVRHTVHIPHLQHPSAEARFFEKTAGLLSCPPHPTTTHRAQNTKRNHNKQMDVHFEDFKANQHTVEVGADDTAEHMRRKVASAMGLPEDSFCMSFGDEAMVEGYDMTQLSAGDTIVLTKSKKYEAVAELRALGETNLTSERLKKVKDPEVACLLLQAEVATVIPDWFLWRGSLTRLDLSAVSFVTQIGDKFLYDCTSLTSIDLSGLSNVTRIGNNFLYNCEALTTLDLTPLNNVTKIERHFLYGCEALTTLDLTPLNNVTKIEAYLLCGCKGLTNLDLTPLSNVTRIEKYFLSGCNSLTTLDLTPLSRMTVISGRFLSGCEALSSLDLTPLNNVTVIEESFLYRCSAFTTLDLTPLKNVTKIEECFLCGCKGLTTLDLTPLSNVTMIDGSFLSYCKALTTLDLTPLKNVTKISGRFLGGCNSLTSLDLTPLKKVKNVGTYFAAHCTSLRSIYLSGCSSAVSNKVRKTKKLSKLVVEERPKRSRDESPEQARKRQRHAQ